jgi:hypothetical protein|tara:strand:- start:309 stop:851 length:543 start_codon:yes stop_codon:yes gene_type:complete
MSSKYFDLHNKIIAEMDSLAQVKNDSIQVRQRLAEMKAAKTKQDSLNAAKADEGIDYTYGIFSDEEGMKHRAPQLTGGGIFTEGSKGEEPMFKLQPPGFGFVPVPNLGFNQISSEQPSSYIERDELGYLTSGYDTPMPLRAGFLGPSDEIGVSPDSYNQMYIDKLLETLEKLPKKSTKGK